VIGYAGTTRFRPKAAYDTTIETTIYCSTHAIGKGIGGALYSALFEAIASEDIRTIVAGYTLPNPASAALHARFSFKTVGILVYHRHGLSAGDWFERRQSAQYLFTIQRTVPNLTAQLFNLVLGHPTSRFLRRY